MSEKNRSDIALEMYESVMKTKEKQKRLKSSTFWELFHIEARHAKTVAIISKLLDDQGLKFAVKSGAIFGQEDDSDWIMLTPKFTPPPSGPSDKIVPEWPPLEWFEMILARNFDSEREVESYFVCPLLEKLGYEYDDIVMGQSVQMYKGVQKGKAEADFVLFNGADRSKENVLLIIEVKKNDKGISSDHIGQARSYAQELLPACYMVTNGQQIVVFQFNGSVIPDERVMDFDKKDLRQKWNDLYNYTSREATIQRKLWLVNKLKSISNEATYIQSRNST